MAWCPVLEFWGLKGSGRHQLCFTCFFQDLQPTQLKMSLGLCVCVCVCVCVKVRVLVAQSCLTLCDPMRCSPPGSSVHGILQARILEWVATSSSRRSSGPRIRIQVSCIVGRFFTVWATREVPYMYMNRSAMQETIVWYLGQKDPLEKNLATHSSILASPWTRFPLCCQQRAPLSDKEAASLTCGLFADTSGIWFLHLAWAHRRGRGGSVWAPGYNSACAASDSSLSLPPHQHSPCQGASAWSFIWGIFLRRPPLDHFFLSHLTNPCLRF